MEVIMKKEITTAILTLATVFGFAQDTTPTVVDPIPQLVQLEVKPALPSVQEKVTPKKSFGYLRMGVSDSEVQEGVQHVLPGLGLGYRMAAGASAIDLSTSFNRRTVHGEEGKEQTYVYTLPKA